MFSNFYSFIKEEDEQGIDYTFGSLVNNIVYYVSFNINNYDQYLNEYPALLQNSYSLGFKSKPFSQRRYVGDSLVSYTIYQIITDFMLSDTNKETVLLYHCDTSDNKQVYRHKLFGLWEKKAVNTNLFKHTIEVEIQKPEQDFTTDYYLGFITRLDNPVLEKVKAEFEVFSNYIAQPKF